MKKYFITYSNDKYEFNRQRLNKIAETCFDKIISYSPKDIDLNFYENNKFILEQPRGIGYWLWKPYVISKTLETMSDNDVLLYLDSGDIFTPAICNYINDKIITNDLILVPSSNIQKTYTKRDCFYYMDCDTEEYWKCTQIEAGIIIIKKTDFSKKIVNEWLNYGENPNIITDLPNICGLENSFDFKDHRHDQSILSNLAYKYNILLDNSVRKYIQCNVI